MTERTKIERVGGHLLIGDAAIPIAPIRAFSCAKADVQCYVWSDNDPMDVAPIVAHGWTAREVLEVAYGGGEWLYYPKPTDETRALVDEINALVETGSEEIERLRARVAEIERDLDACRVELLEARHTVGEGWFADGATLAEGVARKCRMLEGDAEHWRRAAEARSLRAEDGDHVLHRFAALAAAKNEGRSAITLTVWSDGTVDAEQYATLDGDLDEWGTLYQERRASWGSRPIGELDALVDDLESGDWYTVEHRAPQDFWGEIAVLRDEVERLRGDINMACENTPWPGCECPGCETARERLGLAQEDRND